MLKLKTCFLISLFQVAANHGNEKPKQVPKIIVRSFKILFNAIYVYIYTACTETVHNFRKIVSIHNLYQHLLDLCQCNALNEKWLPDYLLLSNLLLLSSSYSKFSKKSKKNSPSLFAMKTLANSKNNGDENSSEGKHDSYFIEIFYVHDICEPR